MINLRFIYNLTFIKCFLFLLFLDSWVDLNVTGDSRGSGEGSQKRLTPISSYINSGKLEKLLWEAQRESCHSSLIGSGISSNKGRYGI